MALPGDAFGCEGSGVAAEPLFVSLSAWQNGGIYVKMITFWHFDWAFEWRFQVTRLSGRAAAAHASPPPPLRYAPG